MALTCGFFFAAGMLFAVAACVVLEQIETLQAHKLMERMSSTEDAKMLALYREHRKLKLAFDAETVSSIETVRGVVKAELAIAIAEAR